MACRPGGVGEELGAMDARRPGAAAGRPCSEIKADNILRFPSPLVENRNERTKRNTLKPDLREESPLHAQSMKSRTKERSN